MEERRRQSGTGKGALLSAALLSLLIGDVGWTDSQRPADPIVATSPAGKPLDLLLSQAELRSVVRNYEIKTGEVLTTPIGDEEVIVRAPGVLAPMRDVSQEAWGGIAAPFWAVMNPGQAWRIFVPIPPKGPREEAKPIRAEDR